MEVRAQELLEQQIRALKSARRQLVLAIVGLAVAILLAILLLIGSRLWWVVVVALVLAGYFLAKNIWRLRQVRRALERMIKES